MKKQIIDALRNTAHQPWAMLPERASDVAKMISGAFEVVFPDVAAAVQRMPGSRNGKGVAIVPVRGICLYDINFPPFVTGMRQLAATINDLAADETIGAIILDINSPGGTSTGVMEAADAIYAAAQKKKVVSVVAPLCASAAYWLASGSSEIALAPSGDVGSVGVYMMHINEAAALQQMGIEIEFIQAGKYKTEGNPFQALSQEARERFQFEVDSVYGDFLKAVARGRGTTVADVRDNFGQGRLLLPKEAKAVGMIDRIEPPEMTFARIGAGAAENGGRRAEAEQITANEALDQLGAAETIEAIVPIDGGTTIIVGVDVADEATAPPRRTRLEILRRT